MIGLGSQVSQSAKALATSLGQDPLGYQYTHILKLLTELES